MKTASMIGILTLVLLCGDSAAAQKPNFSG